MGKISSFVTTAEKQPDSAGTGTGGYVVLLDLFNSIVGLYFSLVTIEKQ